MNYYRSPPPAKETKTKKQHDHIQDGGNDDDDNKKRIYKKKIDIRQGEKDYKKWMTTIQMLKKNMENKVLTMLITLEHDYW